MPWYQESWVYDRHRIKQDFSLFSVTRSYKDFMHAPPLPVHGLPGEELIGWHLLVHREPNADGIT